MGNKLEWLKKHKMIISLFTSFDKDYYIIFNSLVEMQANIQVSSARL